MKADVILRVECTWQISGRDIRGRFMLLQDSPIRGYNSSAKGVGVVKLIFSAWVVLAMVTGVARGEWRNKQRSNKMGT